MRVLKGIVLTGIGTVVLAASVLAATAKPGQSQSAANKGPAPVEVVNSNPIATFISNTINANVTGLPSVAVGDPSARKGLPIIDVREAARPPFAFWEEFHFEEGDDKLYQMIGEHHQVPADSWVVLNYANVVACAQPEEKISLRMWITYDYSAQGLGRGERAIQVLLNEQGVFLEPEGVYMHLAGSQAMNLYMQPGAEYWFEIWRSGEGPEHVLRGHAEGAIWLSGYSVPAVQFQGVGTSP